MPCAGGSPALVKNDPLRKDDMMKTSLIATLATLALTLPVAAQDAAGDPAKGRLRGQ